MCALLAIATSGCEQVNDAVATVKAKIDALRHRTPAQPTPAPVTPQPQTPAPVTSPQELTPARPAPPPRRTVQAPELPRPIRDEPYDSPDTGTIAPGMSEKDVYSLWGPPIAVRRQGDMTFLYFRNGCEYTCGTEDVVFLQNGRVVDAIVRWPGHGYSGQSSSPPGKKHGPTRGGDTLRVHTR